MCDIKPGMMVKFVGATNEQVKWGGNDDPREHLTIGNEYVVEGVEVHSWHTKLYLESVPGRFNSASFEISEIGDSDV